ncbi:hypothetical protein [Sphingobium subterraneum]|uniref:Uncharacterized protein n=1 Tax=Sphingobium subterraneum TaxID=627688 RepID=A0A841IZ04_9SPHN|nr:hypothetical protein [Sphingobium subterraneum]MBB6124189.1 hypothetical protein [Sphingobium subterraneum]
MSELITKTGMDPSKGQSTPMPRREPAGDVQPDENDIDPRTAGGQPQEKVEDRPNVSTVTPEDYPEADRNKG